MMATNLDNDNKKIALAGTKIIYCTLCRKVILKFILEMKNVIMNKVSIKYYQLSLGRMGLLFGLVVMLNFTSKAQEAPLQKEKEIITNYYSRVIKFFSNRLITIPDKDIIIDENGVITQCYLDPRLFDLYFSVRIPDYATNKETGEMVKVTEIGGEGIFKGKQEMQFVALPFGLKKIAPKTFANCSLRYLELPWGLEEIGDYAFAENGAWVIKIADNPNPNSNILSKLTTIGNGAFFESYMNIIMYGSGETHVNSFHEGLTEIGEKAFYMIDKKGTPVSSYPISKITPQSFPSTLVKIGDSAFYNHDIPKIIFKSSVNNTLTIGVEAFKNNNITELTLPDNLISLGTSCFENNSISKIDSWGHITTISNSCFKGNQLSEVRIPKKIKEIGSKAFANNRSLTSFHFTLEDEEKTSIEKLGKNTFLNSPDVTIHFAEHSNTDVLYFAGSDGSEQEFDSDNSLTGVKVNIEHTAYGVHTLTPIEVTVENGVIIKCSYKFHVKHIRIPKKIGINIITGIGDDVFTGKGIISVELPTTLTSIGNSAFKENKIKEIELHEGISDIGSSAFGENELTTISFPSTLTSLKDSSFMNNKLKEVKEFGGVDSIGDFTFRSNDFETIDNLPADIKTIGFQAFADNPELTSVQFEEPSSLEKISNGAFGNKIGSIVLPSHEDANFSHYQDTQNNTYGVGEEFVPYINSGTVRFELNSIEKYTLTNDDLTTDKNGVIIRCKEKTLLSNKGIKIPRTVGEGKYTKTIIGIADGVFSSYNLATVELAPELKFIGHSAFKDNRLLRIDLPSSVVSLGDSSFAHNSIKEITSFGAITELSRGVFNDNRLETLTIPSGIKYIREGSFTSNPLSEVSFSSPSSILIIEANSFSEGNPVSIDLPQNSNPGFLNYIASDWSDNIGSISDFSLSYFARRSYVLTDEDLILDENAVIIDCSKDVLLEYTDITIPSSLPINRTITGIGKGIFSSSNLFSVVLPSSLTVVGDSAFLDNHIKSISFPEGITYLGVDAFNQNYLHDISLPSTLTSFGAGVFSNNKINEIASFGRITSISSRAFANNNLTNIEFPVEIEHIGEYAFTNNDNLVSVSFASGGSKIEFIAANSFDIGSPSFLILPDHALAGSGFLHYNDSKNIKHYSGDVIYDFSVSYLAEKIYHTFSTHELSVDEDGIITGCSYVFSISDIIIPSEIDGKTIIGISDSVFMDKGITSVKFPSTLTSIGKQAFQGNKFQNLRIPITVEYIENRAFSDCYLLSSVIFSTGSKIKHIGDSSFYNSGVTSITLPSNGNDDFKGYIDSDSSIYQPKDIITNFKSFYTTILIHILTDDDVTTIGGVITSCDYNFNSKIIEIPKTLDTQTITGIGDNVFMDKGITSVKLPSTLTSIGHNAFQFNKISTIDFPASLIELSTSSFAENKISKIISFGGIKVIDDNAFRSNKFENLLIPKGVEYIGSYAFRNIADLSEVTFEQGSKIQYIAADAFFKGKPESITLPSNSNPEFLNYENLEGTFLREGDQITSYSTPYFIRVTPYKLTANDLVIRNGIITECSYDFSIKEIIIPSSVSINNINIPITGIGDGIFSGKRLLSVDFAHDISSIGTHAFSENNLIELFLPSFVEVIGDSAFYDNGLTSSDLLIPFGVTDIGIRAFDLNSLTGELLFPASVKTIGDGAFKLSSKLSKISFSNESKITKVGANAFSSSLEIDVELPSLSRPKHSGYWLDENLNNLGPSSFSISDFSISYEAIYLGRVSLELESFPDIEQVDFTVTPLSTSEDGLYGVDTEVTLEASTENEGYRFAKWEINDEIIRESTTNLTLDDDTYIKAYFSKQITVTHTSSDGGKVELSPSYSGLPTYDKDSTLTFSAIAAKNYRFEKWVVGTQEIFLSTFKVILRKDISISAYFIEQVKLSLEKFPTNGGTAHVTSPSYGDMGAYDINSDVTFTAYPAIGYTFYKWKIGDNDYYDAEVKVKLESNTIATAYFEEPMTLKLLIDGLGQVKNIHEGNNTLRRGSPFTLEAEASQGYEFEKWVIGGKIEFSDPHELASLDSNLTIKAVFKAKPFSNFLTVKVGIVGEGEVSPSLGEIQYSRDISRNLVFSATPDAGYRFVEWEINGQTFEDSQRSFELEDDIEATAYFSKQLTLFSSNTEGGSLYVSPPSNGLTTYDIGSKVTISTSEIEDGYRFDKWEIKNADGTYSSYDKIIELELSSDTHVKAHFIKQVRIIVMAENGSLILETSKTLDANSAYDVDIGSSITITAEPDLGYEFEKMILRGEHEFTNFNVRYKITVNEDNTIEAFFKSNLILGVDDFEESTISYYPNPVEETLFVGAEGIQYAQLRSLEGRVVCESLNLGSSTHELSLGHLISGIYFLYLTKEDGTEIVKKVIKR